MKKEFTATGYVVKDGKTLLINHRKLSKWLPPGGHIRENETPEETLLRELKEETGLDVEIIAEKRGRDVENEVRGLFIPNHMFLEEIDGKHQHIDLIYFCRPRGGEVKLKTDEHSDIRWFSPEELESSAIPLNVRDFGSQAIKELCD